MTTQLLGIRVSEELHKAAHTTATMQGKTLKDWLTPIIQNNLHPNAVALFLPDSAQRIDLIQSIPESSSVPVATDEVITNLVGRGIISSPVDILHDLPAPCGDTDKLPTPAA